MSDERLQALRRRVAEGDDQAVFALARELNRVGVSETKKRDETQNRFIPNFEDLFGELFDGLRARQPEVAAAQPRAYDGPRYCGACFGTGVGDSPLACPACGGNGVG